jgi:hypothetical protein
VFKWHPGITGPMTLEELMGWQAKAAQTQKADDGG